MASWPGNPIARMSVDNFPNGSTSSIEWTTSGPDSQTVLDIQIEWTISIDFWDHPVRDNGFGHFDAWLYRLSDTGTWDPWVEIDHQVKNLGNNSDDGFWADTLTLRATMLSEIEVYQIRLYCRTGRVSVAGTEAGPISKDFTAIQGSAFIGDFSLDYMPVSIIYCPPNQDMSASLTQSLRYGTRMTIGASEAFRTDTTAGMEIHALGVKTHGVSTTDSHSMTNRSEAGTEVNYFRNTVLTADNQRAIGRAYWGPLGDIFVIAINPRFSVNRRADGTLFYNNTGIEQLVVVPAYKLIRPGDDAVIGLIPADVRRRLLELDPFITNLDQFFPDSGAALSVASNPYADPSVNNRAECIGIWWLNNATELNYSIGEEKILKTGEATEIQYESTLTMEAGFGFNLFDLIGIGGRIENRFTTIVGLQSSKETVVGRSKTAACYLIRNQNEKDLEGIEIYYDKVFSTLMFRKIPIKHPWIVGTIVGLNGDFISKILVAIIGGDEYRDITMTDQAGNYSFFGLAPGAYTVIVGDQRVQVEVPQEQESFTPSIRADLKGVRRPIDLQESAAWEVALAMEVSSDDVWRLSQHLESVFDEADLAHIFGKSTEQVMSISDRLLIAWPRTPLENIGEISKDELGRLRQAGVESMQELWWNGKNPEALESLADRSKISSERLKEWIDYADRTRVTITKKGSPPPEPKGCLWLLVKWIPWPWLERQLRFRTSKRAKYLFGR